MKVTIEYIAGFFDGEGCVSTHQNRARRGAFGTSISIGQSGDEGRQILAAIQTWLTDRGVNSYLLLRKRKAQYRPMWVLSVMARPSVTAFLALLRPHVSVKKTVVEDTLRFLKLYPSIKGPLTASRNRDVVRGFDLERAQRDRATGLSYDAIAKAQNVSEGFVYERLNPEWSAEKRRRRLVADQTRRQARAS